MKLEEKIDEDPRTKEKRKKYTSNFKPGANQKTGEIKIITLFVHRRKTV